MVLCFDFVLYLLYPIQLKYLVLFPCHCMSCNDHGASYIVDKYFVSSLCCVLFEMLKMCFSQCTKLNSMTGNLVGPCDCYLTK